jgi:hypothetical protein
MPASLTVAASKPKVKSSGESILYGFDFTKILRAGETLSGTPAVTCTAAAGSGAATGDLTIGGELVNVSAFDNDEGGVVAAGKGVQARIADGVAGGDYTLLCRAATSQGDTRDLVCTLQVRDE